jgi:hypothetical protein
VSRRSLWTALALGAAAGCAHGTRASSASLTAPLPRTRAEASGYAETSTYDDVLAYLDSLQRAGVPFVRTELGRTSEGRVLPLLVLSRPRVSTPAEAKALHRPIVYVQANIHAGEVEGKEALLALVRDLASAPGGVLDSVVLLAVPIYNADGNERFAAQSVNRTEQNGPERVGQRPNATGLDLNRDYVKAEAPETRASLAAFQAWDPDVFVDLHTTDGSFHGYALTYAPSLNPAALEAGSYTRDSLLPELRRRMRDRDSLAVFDYGNFDAEYEEHDIADSVKRGWYSYDHRPRFGTNYFGLRQRISILSEAYSHDPFERRVRATYAFVRETLSLVAERGARIAAIASRADAELARGGRTAPVPIRAALTATPLTLPVVFEQMARTGDSSLTEPGVPRGYRRTGVFRTQQMPVYDRFTATATRAIPAAWILPREDSAIVRLLRLHGVRVERLARARTQPVSRFVIDSLHAAPREFQGHHETTLGGAWHDASATIPAGAWIVPGAQPHAVVALYLLDPESDDGFVTWNLFDAQLRVGQAFPVWRALEAVDASR